MYFTEDLDKEDAERKLVARKRDYNYFMEYSSIFYKSIYYNLLFVVIGDRKVVNCNGMRVRGRRRNGTGLITTTLIEKLKDAISAIFALF